MSTKKKAARDGFSGSGRFRSEDHYYSGTKLDEVLEDFIEFTVDERQELGRFSGIRSTRRGNTR